MDQQDRLDRFVAQLYRTGLSVAPERFREWALEQLRGLIRFDGAMWGSGTIKNWRFHTVTLLGVSEDYPRVLEETRPFNPILPQMFKTPNVPIDMEQVCPDEVFFTSEVYRKCFRKFGIRRMLATAHPDPRSGLVSILSIYRKNRRHRFTDAENRLQKSATYHLFEAASHSYFLHLSRTFAQERALGGAAAVVDTEGIFHETMPQFLDLIEEYFPNHKGDGLPFPIPPPGQTVAHDDLCVKSQPLGDLYCLLVWPSGPLDRLTERERQVVFAVTQGLSFKQVAQDVGVAPSTVANHLYRVYRKLGVSGRGQLADLVYPSGKAY